MEPIADILHRKAMHALRFAGIAKRPVIFTPIYNEETNIENHLQQISALQKNGQVGHALLIDDGSNDNTLETATRAANRLKMKDITILHFEKNHGKAMAFFEGLRYFKDRFGGKFPRGQKMIMLDADIKGITAKALHDMHAPIGKRTERERLSGTKTNHRTGMVIGNVENARIDNNGQRAFELREFNPLMERKSMQLMLLGEQYNARGGYGLEKFLNWYFTREHSGRGLNYNSPHVPKQYMAGILPRAEIAKTPFTTGPPTSDPKTRSGRTAGDAGNSSIEVWAMGSRIDDRKNFAHTAKTIRHELSEMDPWLKKILMKNLKSGLKNRRKQYENSELHPRPTIKRIL